MRPGLLDDIARLPPGDLPAVLAAVAARMATVQAEQVPTVAPAEPDRGISLKEAAGRLGISESFLYKNASHLPFVRRIGRRLVCSTAAMDRWQSSPSRRA